MLLKEIKLHNIRSYAEGTISFPEGSMVLAGDIGCGKSSILLAVEFALFGVSRPDLPAELLLRKGATNGWVELSFILDGKEIIVKRVLKKDKNGIKQLPGHLIINGSKKELMPVELKAEIIQLLGYPEDILTKNKNYIFRYTVYTPQEEMKYILQENSEVRLDVLRKIFNIDKYKTIRENLQFYLKHMRISLAVLEAKVEPLHEELQKKKLLLEEEEEITKEIKAVEPKLQEIQQREQQQRDLLQQEEKAQQQFLTLQQQLETNSLLIKEKQKQLQQLREKQQHITAQFSEVILAEDLTKEEIQKEIEEINSNYQQKIMKKTQLQEKINHVIHLLKEKKKEIEKMQEIVKILPEKQKSLEDLQQEIVHKKAIEEKIQQLEHLQQQMQELVTKNKTILEQAKEVQQKISSLETCPLCKQSVPQDHKKNIIEEEQKKINQAEELFRQAQQRKQEMVQQLTHFQQQFKAVQEKEKFFTKIELELEQLQKNKQDLKQHEDRLASLASENNQLMKELQQLQQEEKLEEMKRQLQEKQDVLQKILRRKMLLQQQQEIEERMSLEQQELQSHSDQKKQLEEISCEKKDNTEVLEKIRQELQKIMADEKTILIRKAELQTKLHSLQKQLQEKESEIKVLTEEKNHLIRNRERYTWLEQYFLKLTYTLEKHMMIRIHRSFNDLFQEWFAILINDESVYSRIDDSFTPIIEQNGYEISFQNLSGGERTSCALAYRLALNRVINDIVHEIKTKNLLILDEPTDGFSAEQLDKVRDVLERLALRQTIVVSHESKVESFVENIIRIVKEGHHSFVSE